MRIDLYIIKPCRGGHPELIETDFNPIILLEWFRIFIFVVISIFDQCGKSILISAKKNPQNLDGVQPLGCGIRTHSFKLNKKVISQLPVTSGLY